MDGDWLLCISMVGLHGVRAEEGVDEISQWVVSGCRQRTCCHSRQSVHVY